MSTELRFRQVHLDFHTSPHIPGIGAEFDPEHFVHTLKEAAVDSITCFSRCHHGYIYHETKFPYQHPDLKCNLLIEQVRACHKADIRVPVYITVGWDHLQSSLHPEWNQIDENGMMIGRKPLTTGWGWYFLDFASPYVDFLEQQTAEICEMLGDELDGVFFDIIHQREVFSRYCMERLSSLGWSPEDKVKQKELCRLLVKELCDRLASVVRRYNKDATIFFNGGHIDRDFRDRLDSFTHLEIESLPSGGWGYMHFPITSRYARTMGLDFLGMTGKFSESWGHFNSYKNEAALEFECFSALAQGGKISVGDQLHPSGKLDRKTYELIGSIFRQVRELEPYCVGARSVAEIAVVNSESYGKAVERMDPRNLGAARILMEGQHQFDYVDLDADLNGYKVLIITDGIPILDTKPVEDFLANGGKVIVAADSILNERGEVHSVFQSAVTSSQGALPFSPDFLQPIDEDTAYVMYEKGISITASPGTDILATINEPYFNRTWDHFCSHAHTPVANRTQKPGIVLGEKVAVFAHPIFSTYAKHSMSFHRNVVLSVLDRLLPNPLVKIKGPKSLQATLTKQGDRHILHLLHYVPERRALNFDVIEDRMWIPPLEIEIGFPVKSARIALSGEALPVEEKGDSSVLKVPASLGKLHVVLE